jgi:hypothetical protein
VVQTVLPGTVGLLETLTLGVFILTSGLSVFLRLWFLRLLCCDCGVFAGTAPASTRGSTARSCAAFGTTASVPSGSRKTKRFGQMFCINTAILVGTQVRAGVNRSAYMRWRPQRAARPPKSSSSRRRGYKSVMAARMLQRFQAETACAI